MDQGSTWFGFFAYCRQSCNLDMYPFILTLLKVSKEGELPLVDCRAYIAGHSQRSSMCIGHSVMVGHSRKALT